jgi:hypothetical protein
VATGEKELGEAHSPYHEYLYKLSKIKDQMFTHAGRKIATERNAFLKAFFDQLGAEVRGER